MENARLEFSAPNVKKCKARKRETGIAGTRFARLENARLELSAPDFKEMQGWKTRDCICRDPICRGGKRETGIVATKLAGMENARLQLSVRLRLNIVSKKLYK